MQSGFFKALFDLGRRRAALSVIGRKNYLFCDSVAGAKSSANLYSLIETANANGIEPYAYLKMIFTELPQATSLEEIEALLPISSNSEENEAA